MSAICISLEHVDHVHISDSEIRLVKDGRVFIIQDLEKFDVYPNVDEIILRPVLTE